MENEIEETKCWRCDGFGDYITPYFGFLICHICKGTGKLIKKLTRK